MAAPVATTTERKDERPLTWDRGGVPRTQPRTTAEPTLEARDAQQDQASVPTDEDEYEGPAEDEWGEIIVDYSYLDRAAREAVNLPVVALTTKQLEALRRIPTTCSYELGIDYEDDE